MTTADRYRLARCGIVNLYEYADQTFELAGGRLLLRGHNTSGKTKALELLLPFCLDGDISPSKLDPFAKTAKEMKWNLVGCVEADQRIGYVWLEFERLAGEGPRRVTAGIGLKANTSVKEVTRWYFLAEERRVGDDLRLVRDSLPLSKRELAVELGDEATLLDTPSEYRRALNRMVFGFAGEEQYKTMITLMLELRRPHLSKALNPREVTQLLSASLPEVDHELMRRLGDGLDQLEEMRSVLQRMRDASARLGDFHEQTYRAYARAAVKERGDALRSAETGYENAARARRQAEDAAAQALLVAKETHGRLRAAVESEQRLDGELRALLGSEEWRSVETLEALGESARRQEHAAAEARSRAEQSAGDATSAEADAITAQAACEEAERDVQGDLDELAALADRGGFVRVHKRLVGELPGHGEPLALWRGLAEDELGRWRAHLEAHERLLKELARAEANLAIAREHEDSAGLRVRDAREQQQLRDHEVVETQERIARAVESWMAELRELVLDEAARELVLARALQAGEGDASSPAETWAGAAAQRLGELLDREARVRIELDTLAERLGELRAERDALEQQRDMPPQPVAARPAERDGRAGAPLWRLVDFTPELTPTQRAGIEAALEGAGLLDAWVMPTGKVLEPEVWDAVLVSGDRSGVGQLDGPTLADLLLPGDDAPVPTSVLTGMLSGVAVADDATAADGPAIDVQGGYALGPLRGRYGKAQAEHIGAAARAARRAARLAELAAELGDVERRIEESDAQREALAASRGRLAAEQRDFPSLTALLAARRAQAAAETHVERLLQEQAACEAATLTAAGALQSSRTEAEWHAREAGLPAGLQARELQGLRDAVLQYAAGARALERTWIRFAQASAHAEALEVRARELVDRSRALERAAVAEEGEARRLLAEHGEREANLSRGAQQVRERKRAVEQQRDAARESQERLHDEDKDAAVAASSTATASEAAGREAELAREQRERALAMFARLERSDMFVLALEEHAPADHADATSWTLTRALEALRAMPAERLRVRSSLNSLANSVTHASSQLDRELAQHVDMSVLVEHDADGLVLVRVRDGAAERPLAELMERLDSEVGERERALSAEQRRVLGDALLEEIALHLADCIHDVGGQVEDMNATLRRASTAAGKIVQLGWVPREDDSVDLRQIVALLRRSPAARSEDDRGALLDFFRARIEHARRAAAEGATPESVVDSLRGAFDYRDWFEFELWEGRGEERQRLTARRHATGSGGEQAVLVHLPLFAAAAALYNTSHERCAPRLVMLDEALSGIDDETRERVLGATVDLDLDLVMTSHEMWGTYRTVPALSIYQLYREQGTPGVGCEHFLWDGALLREQEQAELFRV
ncbi:MAG TPA: TIGR02680 family protein [Solirubrobacteraceae bacterium]|nr:TIGR02680 family protein [Solirubrobacteraceae bacterium]